MVCFNKVLIIVSIIGVRVVKYIYKKRNKSRKVKVYKNI